MLTITKLAKRFNISRTTVLYYENEGLISPSYRTESGYRQYGKKEIKRLEAILSYRAFGISVKEISRLLAEQKAHDREKILRAQFSSLDQEIQRLKRQQAAIVVMLKEPSLVSDKEVSVEEWTELMTLSGFTDQDMHLWHQDFEQLDPAGHHKFLQSLSIDEKRIAEIRHWSATASRK